MVRRGVDSLIVVDLVADVVVEDAKRSAEEEDIDDDGSVTVTSFDLTPAAVEAHGTEILCLLR